MTKINPLMTDSNAIAEIEQQRKAHCIARARMADEIASTAAEVRKLRAQLKQAVVDGHRLGIGMSELGRLAGSDRHTMYRWVARAMADRPQASNHKITETVKDAD